MTYTDHFRLVDDVTAHFDASVALADPFIQSRYVGFYSITAAAVVELALKEIVISFATSKNQLFGDYVEAKYEQINGRIKINNMLSEHLAPFGEAYQKRFKKLLDRVDRVELRRRNLAIKASYGNLLACRHTFAHEGSVPTNSSYDDVKRGFDAGKVVLSCLAKTLAPSP